ncbi:helix-turn-helix domain-containing protein [Pseudovibrio exalbescens]|uniref:helix-turn-helix domain-containing protein n=1 Tax=Pseudovibrio exalbescens TaxID=197461 RepID=UPI00093FB103|nr:helix-turn-helix transcriptional regulator [Pseudovibrio exalbescens]
MTPNQTASCSNTAIARSRTSQHITNHSSAPEEPTDLKSSSHDYSSPNWGTRLHAIASERGWTKQLSLASALNVDVSTVSRWLKGGQISLDHLIQLSTLLDVSLDWLVLGRGTPTNHRCEQEAYGPACPQNADQQSP